MTDNLILSVFVAVEGAHAFSAFMPSYFTVHKFARDEKDLRDLRSGYQPAIAFNLLLGTVVSAMTKDATPLMMSILVIIFMLFLYERAVTEEDKDGTKEKQV